MTTGTAWVIDARKTLSLLGAHPMIRHRCGTAILLVLATVASPAAGQGGSSNPPERRVILAARREALPAGRSAMVVVPRADPSLAVVIVDSSTVTLEQLDAALLLARNLLQLVDYHKYPTDVRAFPATVSHGPEWTASGRQRAAELLESLRRAPEQDLAVVGRSRIVAIPPTRLARP